MSLRDRLAGGGFLPTHAIRDTGRGDATRRTGTQAKDLRGNKRSAEEDVSTEVPAGLAPVEWHHPGRCPSVKESGEAAGQPITPGARRSYPQIRRWALRRAHQTRCHGRCDQNRTTLRSDRVRRLRRRRLRLRNLHDPMGYRKPHTAHPPGRREPAIAAGLGKVLCSGGGRLHQAEPHRG